MSRNRIVVWLLVLAIGGAAAYYIRGSAQEAPPVLSTRVLFITGGDGPFWQITAAGAHASAKAHDAELDLLMPAEEANKQGEMLSDVGLDAFDGVAVSPLNPEQQSESLKRIAGACPLVTFDSDAPKSERMCYIGTDNYSAGRLCAKLVKEVVPEGGKVAVLVATFDKDNAQLRHEGFVDELKLPVSPVVGEGKEDAAWDLVATLEDGIDGKKCRQNIRTVLSEHADLACLVGMFAYHGALMADEATNPGDPGMVKLIAFDEDDAVLDAIADGKIHATVVQDPYKYGYEAVRLLTELHRGRPNELPIGISGSLFLPAEAIRKDDVAKFRERLAQRLRQPVEGE